MKLIQICQEIRKGIEYNYDESALIDNSSLLKDLSFKGKNESLNAGLIYDINNYTYSARNRIPLSKNIEISGDYFIFYYKGHDDIYELCCFDDIENLKKDIVDHLDVILDGFITLTVPLINGKACEYKIIYLDSNYRNVQTLDLLEVLYYKQTVRFKDIKEIHIEFIG